MVKLLQVSTLFLTLASFTMGAPTHDVVERSLAPVESSTQFAARDAQPLLFARDDELTVRSEDLEARFFGALLRVVPKLAKLGHHAHHNNDKNKQKRSDMDIESRSDSESVELDRRISKALHRSNEKAKHAFQKIGGVLKGVIGL